MTKRNLKLLHEAFAEEFLRRLPGYSLDARAVLPRGGRSFRREGLEGRTFFVVLGAWARDELFTIECASSLDGHLPPASELLDRDEILGRLNTGVRFRLGHLITGEDLWWRLGPEPRSLLDEHFAIEEFATIKATAVSPAEVRQLVKEVVEHLQTHWAPLTAGTVAR